VSICEEILMVCLLELERKVSVENRCRVKTLYNLRKNEE